MSTPSPAIAPTNISSPTPTPAVAPASTVVIVEDDAAVRDILIELFESAGFTAVGAENGVDGVEAVRAHNPRITTIDVNMPGIDGFETAKRVRAISETYIVLVTARAEEADAVLGLSIGADDYVTKPFRPREFRARVEAMLRRPRGFAPRDAPAALEPTSTASPSVLIHRDITLDTSTRAVHKGDDAIVLTRTEFDLLRTLLESQRRARSKEDLALVARGDTPGVVHVSELDKRAIESHMTNIRRKLGDPAAMPVHIETVRGVGYRLTVDAATQR
ncbi:response regulator transcription factor [Microbacterium sp.]|uniref:response regulator transcription factor n=1 Tax=Microbacterium sp. TaxID=51671 RepID=UPI0025D64D5D|nr:response regulator transcription factor [Microbacterium sp.]